MAQFVSTLDLCDEYASSGDSDAEQTPVVVRPKVNKELQTANKEEKELDEKRITGTVPKDYKFNGRMNGGSADKDGGHRQRQDNQHNGGYENRRYERVTDDTDEKNGGIRQENQRNRGGYENRRNERLNESTVEKDGGYRQGTQRNRGGYENRRNERVTDDTDEKYGEGNQRNHGGYGNRANEEGSEDKEGDYRQNGPRNRGGGSGGGRGGYRNDTNSRGRPDGGARRDIETDESFEPRRPIANRGRGGNRTSGPPRNGSENGQDEQTEVVRIPLYIPPIPSTDEVEIFGQNISSGINFEKYDKIPVKVTGENIPKARSKFSEFGLTAVLLENIRKSGYDQPTPIQKNAIPVLLEGRDLMGCAQTGSGKTAAFLLPLLNVLIENKNECKSGYPQAVIMSPTRELAIQISLEANKFAHNSGLKICLIYGGTSKTEQSRRYNQGCHVLVATPGRLLDFMDMGMISYKECKFFVLDEADRMLDMGFQQDVETVMNHTTISKTESRQTLMFSATFPEEIQRLAGKYLDDYIFIAIGEVGGACADVEQVIVEVNQYAKRDKLMEILAEDDCSGTLIFVETKKSTDFLAVFLSETEYPTTSIHGDRLQQQREEALADFKNNRMKILIATSVAARGLDIKNVKHVINFDLPNSIDEYVHRIGRTGRVGNKGKATSFFNAGKDADMAAPLVRILNQANQLVPEFLKTSGGNYMAARPNRDMRFGGRDVRSQRKPENAQPSAQEPDEHW